jgi:hypothetical protein
MDQEALRCDVGTTGADACCSATQLSERMKFEYWENALSAGGKIPNDNTNYPKRPMHRI